MGMVTFFAYLWLQVLTIWLLVKNITLLAFALLWGLFLAYFAGVYVSSGMWSMHSLNGYGAAMVAFKEPSFHLICLLCVGVTLVPVLVATAWQFNFSPTSADLVRAQSRKRNTVKIAPVEVLPNGTFVSDGDKASARAVKIELDKEST